MSKITDALKRIGNEKANIISPMVEKKRVLTRNIMGWEIPQAWFSRIFIGIAVVMVLIAFNYHGDDDAVLLTEIFPNEEVFPVDVEYEFVQEDQVADTMVKSTAMKQKGTPLVNNIATEPAAVYTIQIASFKNKGRAQEALAKIQTNVPSAYIGSRNLGAKGIWYRVYAGRFGQRNEAEMALSGIKQNYDSSFIISPPRAP